MDLPTEEMKIDLDKTKKAEEENRDQTKNRKINQNIRLKEQEAQKKIDEAIKELQDLLPDNCTTDTMAMDSKELSPESKENLLQSSTMLRRINFPNLMLKECMRILQSTASQVNSSNPAPTAFDASGHEIKDEVFKDEV